MSGVGLELSSLPHRAATPSDAPLFELQLATEDDVVIDGDDKPGAGDLVAHFAMTRARGLALVGPPPRDVFVPIDRARLLRSFADDLTWALEQGRPGYCVLNACRALWFAREGRLCSKLEGGEWALAERVADPSLIATALRRQRGADESVDPAAATLFASETRDRLVSADRAS
jgi:hypothetical protein